MNNYRQSALNFPHKLALIRISQRMNLSGAKIGLISQTGTLVLSFQLNCAPNASVPVSDCKRESLIIILSNEKFPTNRYGGGLYLFHRIKKKKSLDPFF